MPAKSAKQRRYMQKIVHDPSFSAREGVTKAAALKVLGKHRKRGKSGGRHAKIKHYGS